MSSGKVQFRSSIAKKGPQKYNYLTKKPRRGMPALPHYHGGHVDDMSTASVAGESMSPCTSQQAGRDNRWVGSPKSGART